MSASANHSRGACMHTGTRPCAWLAVAQLYAAGHRPPAGRRQMEPEEAARAFRLAGACLPGYLKLSFFSSSHRRRTGQTAKCLLSRTGIKANTCRSPRREHGSCPCPPVLLGRTLRYLEQRAPMWCGLASGCSVHLSCGEPNGRGIQIKSTGREARRVT